MSSRTTTRPEVTTETAYRLRYVRALKLPTNKPYADPRVEKIARIQAQLWELLAKTDKRLFDIYLEMS